MPHLIRNLILMTLLFYRTLLSCLEAEKSVKIDFILLSAIISYQCFHSSAATFHSVSFSKPNPVWFGKVTPKNCVRFSKPIPVWFGKKKIDFARHRFQTKFRLVWEILMTIVNVLKIPNQIQFGLEKSLTIANALNLEPIPVLFWKSHFRKGKHSNIQVQD